MENQKSRGVAIILAVLLGGIGVHRFYLGRMTSGILMLLFCWTFIPLIIAIIDIIRFIIMSDDEFQRRYGTKTMSSNSSISATEELEKLSLLKERGHLTELEFNEKKAKLLSKM